MTPERGYELAKHQRPGVVVVMGPTKAKERRISPINMQDFLRLPGEWTWGDYDWKRRVGIAPSLWAYRFAGAAKIAGHEVTDDEMKWLFQGATLKSASLWLQSLTEAAR